LKATTLRHSDNCDVIKSAPDYLWHDFKSSCGGISWRCCSPRVAQSHTERRLRQAAACNEACWNL